MSNYIELDALIGSFSKKNFKAIDVTLFAAMINELFRLISMNVNINSRNEIFKKSEYKNLYFDYGFDKLLKIRGTSDIFDRTVVIKYRMPKGIFYYKVTFNFLHEWMYADKTDKILKLNSLDS